MINIQILGSGCKSCNKLIAETEKAAKDLGIEYKLEKVTDYEKIAAFNIMSTPALVVNGEVKFFGKVKKSKEIEVYLQ